MTEEIANLDRKAPPNRPVSYDEFLAWSGGEQYAEWVDGVVLPSPPPTAQHQDLVAFFMCALRDHCEESAGGRVFFSGYQTRLADIGRGREPDVMYVSPERRHLITEMYLDGAPDLAIEIVQAETRLIDRGAKYAEYEMSGVKEYWIIDPEIRRADFFVLVGDRYDRRRPDTGSIITSTTVPGFWIDTEWLWQDQLPTQRQMARLLRP